MLDPVELLLDAVAITSVSGREQEVVSFLVAAMARQGWDSFIDDAGNAVAVVGRGGRRVAVVGHVDTVPGDIGARIEDEVLWGRGAVDAKGPFCAAIVAAARLSSAALTGLELTLIGAVEEEAGSRGARHVAQAYPCPDCVIVGEPSGWEGVTLGYKGRLLVELELSVDGFHSAREEPTASELLVEAWRFVKLWQESVNEELDAADLFGRLQVSLLALGSADDGLAQRAKARIGLRLPPALSPEAAEQKLSDWLTRAPYGPRVSVRFSSHEAACLFPKDTFLSRALRAGVRRFGGRPKFKVKTGTSDMNVLARHWQVPMVAYGPGDSSLDHRPDERLELAEYQKAIGVLGAAFEQLSGSAPR